MPVVAGNAAVLDGSLPKIVMQALAELKPEAAYFYTDGGQRTCSMVIDLKDASDIPMIAERFFLPLQASVQFTPVMNADDLRKGLAKSGQ